MMLKTASKKREINVPAYSPQFKVPAKISFVAKTTFTTGIKAVVIEYAIPGNIPIIAGKITKIFNGEAIL